ncbi:methylmalonyl-CoA mutase [Candidatus Wirthbacteria bacterium CG2_30_54_11]|uniref:Methylmalonyl-CoA mutase n=1 Tax=Candidatus Wirthbacteria bacterium CG2_30_54_11 TaxID=1817892 RepID=A0A1J5IMW4_9BACT|nr:MAG: methylmalonyl-CoA mutase [Candidatus Wirthbacteria bacterium CG2_30_54_11]
MKPIRILIAKPGLDGHDRGAKILALMLRDAGFEVIYTGVRQTPRMISDAIIQEDPDVVMLSSLSGGHVAQFRQLFKRLEQKGVTDKLFLAGGIIPEQDYAELKSMGVAHIYGIHDDLDDVAKRIRTYFDLGKSSDAS